jgi:anhydro-N-acetylmuramic acid kinase
MTTPDHLARLRAGERVTAVGLMSGTSADGIDMAVADFWQEAGRTRLQLRADAGALPYTPAVRELLFRCFDNVATPRELCLLNALLGELAADAVETALQVSGLPREELAFVVSHGQTVWHQPEPVSTAGCEVVRGTLQLGEAARIAERLGVPVVSDLRQQDFALGGQGAPLVPYFDYLLLADPNENRAVQNLGGIGNVTYLPAGGALSEVKAFDTGPANALIDRAATLVSGGALAYDIDGKLAASAAPDPELLASLLSEPYLSLAPPKSTGRELFSARRIDELWERGHRGAGLVSTLTDYTVETIAQAYRNWLGPVQTVILGGGGARNPELVRRLRLALAPAKVRQLEDFGLSGDAKEALAFALLGYETLRGVASNVPAATGASRPAIQGKVCRP